MYGCMNELDQFLQTSRKLYIVDFITTKDHKESVMFVIL